MTHNRYVRTNCPETLRFQQVGIQDSRVMPARLTLLLTFCGLFLVGSGQDFLRYTCSTDCQPALLTEPGDTLLACDDALPPFGEILAEACPDTAVSQTVGLELDATTVTRYSVETAFGDGVDWALWLGGFDAMGHGASEHFVPHGDGVHLELYANGTARFSGEVRNDTDPDQQFELDVFLQYRADYDEWTAQGRLPKDDLGLGAYVDWNYFELVDTLSRLIGRGDFEGDMLYLDHMPTSRLFGFQMGVDGANNRNTNMGISGWFWYRGMIAGADVVGTGDINADLTNEETEEVACPVVEEYRRVRMAWSECGHDIHHNTIQRLDEEAPVFLSIPALESADCTQLPDTPGVAAFDLFDACGSDLTLVVSSDVVTGPPCNQILTRTWTLSDACTNSVDTVQTIALVDTTGPTFTVMDTTLVCDEWDNYMPFEIDPEDNCSPAESVTWTFSDTVTSGFYPFQFTLDRIYSATDLCGNVTVDTMTIDVIDTVAPTWVFLPPDTTILCDEWENYTIIQPIVEDNCDPSPEGPAGGGASDTTITEGECFGEFLVELTFEFEDMSGNTISYVQLINAVDTIPPTFPYFPPDTVLDCTETYPQPGDSAIWMATAADNFCPFEVTWTDSLAAGSCAGADTLFRTFTAIDDCENTTTQVQILVRQDTLAPFITDLPEDTLIACGSDLPELIFGAVDNCSGVDSTWISVETLDLGPLSESCPVVERLQRTAYAMDGCGNVAQAIQMVDIIDTLGPVITLMDTTIACDLWAEFVADTPMVLDACTGTADVALTFEDEVVDGIFPVDFTLHRVFTATDACGNASMDTMVIDVIDTVAPILVEVPLDTTILCDQWEDYIIVPPALEDNCDTSSTFAGGWMTDIIEGECIGDYVVLVNFEYADLSGNAVTYVQTITVVDTIAPTFVYFPMDTALACDEAYPLPTDSSIYMAMAEDNCSPLDITWADSLVTGACQGTDTLFRTFTAIDDCGNTTTQVQTLFHIDTVGPVIDVMSIPEPVTIQCMDALPTDVPMAEDACSDMPLLLVSADTTGGEGLCAGGIEVTRTFTFTDACGNTSMASQLVTVVDTVAPEFEELPEPATYYCEEVIPTCFDFDVQAFDGCCETTVTCEEEIISTDCPGTYSVNLTFTATDENDNAATALVVYEVVDTIAPVIGILPNDTTINCAVAETTPTLDSTFFAVEDGCNPWTFAVTTTFEGQEDNPCNYTRIDAYVFTDCNGNAATFDHILTVQDTTGPNIVAVPSDLFLACPQEVPEFDTSLPVSEWADDVLDLQITDECNGDLSEVTATYEDVLAVSVDATHYTLTRKWTFFDHCNNPTEYDQVIDVNEPDLELPNAFSPGGDGIGNGFNDTYVIGNLGLTDDESGYYPPCYWDGDSQSRYFQVFNRWGTLVYETEAGQLYRNDWDGRSSVTGDALPDGTYFVLLILGNGRQWGTFVDLRNDQ